MLIVPLKAIPSQTIQVDLDGQAAQIDVYQKNTGLFVDLYVNNVLVIGGVAALNLNLIVRSAYLGFSGDLIFSDQQGSSDPVYSGLGSRFLLCYLEPADLAAAGFAG